jgi:hypothetical protein
MFFKRVALVFMLLFSCVTVGLAQQDDFCEAVNAITGDAPNQFRNIKGNMRNSGPGVATWACGIKVPGTINSRFVASMGLFYEGAFFQTKKKEEVANAYQKYGAMMQSCLLAQGYKLTLQDNFFPGMKEFKKLVFMRDTKEDAGKAPAHLTMEATYSKEVGYYTVVMYIFEH